MKSLCSDCDAEATRSVALKYPSENLKLRDNKIASMATKQNNSSDSRNQRFRAQPFQGRQKRPGRASGRCSKLLPKRRPTRPRFCRTQAGIPQSARSNRRRSARKLNQQFRQKKTNDGRLCDPGQASPISKRDFSWVAEKRDWVFGSSLSRSSPVWRWLTSSSPIWICLHKDKSMSATGQLREKAFLFFFNKKTLFQAAETKVRVGTKLSEEFLVKVGVHQGAVLSHCCLQLQWTWLQRAQEKASCTKFYMQVTWFWWPGLWRTWVKTFKNGRLRLKARGWRLTLGRRRWWWAG